MILEFTISLYVHVHAIFVVFAVNKVLKITFVLTMCVCVSTPRLSFISSVVWCDMNPI